MAPPVFRLYPHKWNLGGTKKKKKFKKPVDTLAGQWALSSSDWGLHCLKRTWGPHTERVNGTVSPHTCACSAHLTMRQLHCHHCGVVSVFFFFILALGINLLFPYGHTFKLTSSTLKCFHNQNGSTPSKAHMLNFLIPFLRFESLVQNYCNSVTL